MKHPLKTMVTATASILVGTAAFASPRIVLDAHRLMNETRVTPSPAEGDTVGARLVSFQWPLSEEFRGQYDPLDGFEEEAPHPDKSGALYRVRYSQDPTFPAGRTTEATTRWAMLNAFEGLQPGRWYWQYAYGKDSAWSAPVSFVVETCEHSFTPPSFAVLEKGLGKGHPRVWVDSARWDGFRASAAGSPEKQWYIEYAERALQNPMLRIENIDHSELDKLDGEMQRNAYMTQQSRKIVDAEEKNCEALVRAYLLTLDARYAREAIARVMVMTGWDNSAAVVGDFNDSTILSLASLVYDSCHDMLTDAQRAELIAAVKRKGTKMYDRFNNYVEAYLFEDHIWQMTLRITTMAALATMDALPEAREWAEYGYNMWVARMPGVNSDGGWHNGDSYFGVNARTLVELPWLFSRLTGFNFFDDPWYEGSILYTIYQQPPFSKSGGNGSMHLNVGRPNANRVAYLDALARLKQDSRAADYVRRTLAEWPDYLKKSLLSKPGDLAWVRLQTGLTLPDGPGLTSLPMACVLPESGLASGMSDWDNHRRNAWWSFRSSPYGSHSHSLANQNAFNTFYGGKPLFYSSGHHIEFTDLHAMVCHRGTLAHNTVLPGGYTQKIGVEGYGWIPRHYAGSNIAYVQGDASNAYGPVESELWLLRGRQSNVEYNEANGWGEPHLRTFRRHIVDLGYDGLLFVYDELEADSAIEWHYRLHAVARPLECENLEGMVRVTARNGNGVSDAYLMADGELTCDISGKFAVPALDWLKNGGNARPDHSHFTGRTGARRRTAFATVVDTHRDGAPERRPEVQPDGRIRVGKWTITASLDGEKFAVTVCDTEGEASVTYSEGETTLIIEKGTHTKLSDRLPKLEM